MSIATRSRVSGAVVALGVLFLWAPLLVVVLFSLHSTAGLSFPFRGFSLRWYDEILSSPEVRLAAENSLIVAASTAVSTLILGTLAAYGLTHTASRWRTPLTFLFFLPITLPGLFIGIALLAFFSGLNVEFSLLTVALAHFVFSFPFFLLLAREALIRLNPALEEIAVDLGASRWTVFRRVTLPQIWPVLLGGALLAFALSFDEFIITFFVIGPDATLPLYIWSSLRRTIDPSINAIAVVLLAVTIVIFLVTAGLMALAARRRQDWRSV